MQIETNKEIEAIGLRREKEAGFSLLELLMSIVIFSVVIAAVYGLLQVARAGRNMSSERSDLMKQTRYTLNLMGRDALNAGYSYDDTGAVLPNNVLNTRLGIPFDYDTSRDLLVGIVAGDNVNTNSLQQGTPHRTDVISFVYRDITFNPDPSTGSSRTMTLTAATANPTNVTMVTLDGTSTTTNNCRKNDLYLIGDPSSAVLVMATDVPSASTIRFAATDPLSLNKIYTNSLLKACTGLDSETCMAYPQVAMKRVIWVSFMVKNDGTLVRKVFGNNGTVDADQIQEQPLAYGIENLQIKYVLEDGTISDNPAVGDDGVLGTSDDTPQKLNNVRQISFTITARGNDVDSRTGQRNRITLTSTFSTRNMGYNAG
jgi:prepilin-type N-terminal cleavage/methylation domain-containing protein